MRGAPPHIRHDAVPTCVASIARCLSRTCDYVINAKCLPLLHRLAAAATDTDPAENTDREGHTRFLHELLRPTLIGHRVGEPVLALLLDFYDEAHTTSWDHFALVRTYTIYHLDRICFLVLVLLMPCFADDHVRGPPHTAAVADMDTEALMGHAHHLRHLLDRLLACHPTGSTGANRIMRAALHPLLRDSFRVYEDVTLVLNRIFDMDYPECAKAFETYVGTTKQIDALHAFYSWCDDACITCSFDILDVRRDDDKLLETMEPRSARESTIGKTGVKSQLIQMDNFTWANLSSLSPFDTITYYS